MKNIAAVFSGLFLLASIIACSGATVQPRQDAKATQNSGGSENSVEKHDTYGDEIGAFVYAQTVAERLLKSPSTASYGGLLSGDMQVASDCARYDSSDQTWLVRFWVDSQNSFGATIRTYFAVRVYIKNETYELIDVVADNNLLNLRTLKRRKDPDVLAESEPYQEKVTLDRYNLIVVGKTTFAEVESLLGSGELLHSTSDGQTWYGYLQKYDEAQNCQVIFKNGVVTSKVSHELTNPSNAMPSENWRITQDNQPTDQEVSEAPAPRDSSLFTVTDEEYRREKTREEQRNRTARVVPTEDEITSLLTGKNMTASQIAEELGKDSELVIPVLRKMKAKKELKAGQLYYSLQD